MVVNKTNLLSEPRNLLFNLLNDKTKVPDPIDANPTLSLRKMVYTREPSKGTDFGGYPFIILFSPAVEGTEYSLSTTTANMEWEFEGEIRTSDHTVRNAGRGSVLNDQIADSIMETLQDADNRASLRECGISISFPITMDGQDLQREDNDVIYIRRFRFICRKRRVVG